jgi:hypothetical protein
MTDPLPGDKDRHLGVEGKDDLFEWAGVLVPKEIVDETTVLTKALRSGAIADTSRLNDALVASKVVDEPNEALIEHFDFLIKKGVCLFDDDPRHGDDSGMARM